MESLAGPISDLVVKPVALKFAENHLSITKGYKSFFKKN